MRSMASSSAAKGIAAIVGAGAGLGRSIARKFAGEGYTVAILARDLGRLSRLAEEIAMEGKGQVFAIRIDCSDSTSVREAFEGVLSLGFVEILVYNACHQSAAAPRRRPTSAVDLPVGLFEKSVAVSSVGAFHCAQQVLPGMVERRRGTILFTGCSASTTGIPGFTELCCGKFALRGLSQCLAREFQPLGVHVAHVILHGAVPPSRSSSVVAGDSHGPLLDPDVIAQTYWHLHLQEKSAWTQEIDLHPCSTVATTTATAAASATSAAGTRNFF